MESMHIKRIVRKNVFELMPDICVETEIVGCGLSVRN